MACQSSPENTGLAFVDLIERLPRLRYLRITSSFCGDWAATAPRILKVLTTLPQLDSLEVPVLEWLIPTANLDGLTFPHTLKSLTCVLDPMQMDRVYSMFPKIEEWTLQVISPSDSILTSCSKFSCIRELKMSIGQSGTVLNASPLLALFRELRCLETFEILTGKLDGLTDELVSELACARPELREFTIITSNTLGPASLISLGKYCRRLSSCWLPISIPLPDFCVELGAGYFPNLRTLRANWTFSRGKKEAGLEQLRHIAPKLSFPCDLDGRLFDDDSFLVISVP